MEFTYMKTPLYRMTFRNKRIRHWVEQNVEGQVLNLFAGETRLDCAETRNDCRGEMQPDFCMDALDFVTWWRNKMIPIFDSVILDPPYSYRKSIEMYDGAKASTFTHMINVLPDIMTPVGNVITFGYQSNIMGKGRGFEPEHILLMSHGGAIHDTIAVSERRINV